MVGDALSRDSEGLLMAKVAIYKDKHHRRRNRMKSWHVDLIIEDATKEQAQETFSEVVRLIDSKGLTTGGGIHSFGDVEVDEVCQGCPSIVLRLPRGTYHLEEPTEVPPELIIQGER